MTLFLLFRTENGLKSFIVKISSVLAFNYSYGHYYGCRIDATITLYFYCLRLLLVDFCRTIILTNYHHLISRTLFLGFFPFKNIYDAYRSYARFSVIRFSMGSIFFIENREKYFTFNFFFFCYTRTCFFESIQYVLYSYYILSACDV